MTDTTKERAQFETWARLQGDSVSRTGVYGADRRYDSAFTEWEWRGFQAGWMARAEQSTETPPRCSICGKHADDKLSECTQWGHGAEVPRPAGTPEEKEDEWYDRERGRLADKFSREGY